ncbi:hypothetical protein [Streptomyces sp. NPDC046832]|uniref:hypothetical protein n=1 Tax=Streptomyces sp. NPDC046832 TaxID=3155020 RepID=UPI0033C82528
MHRHSRGRKVVNHRVAGTMDLAYDDFALPGDPHVSSPRTPQSPWSPLRCWICTAGHLSPRRKCAATPGPWTVARL